ncbi:hypothetical protein Q1695_001765 [Nippostrongylus brasiliensis]|nr:hypothetical protein Q1695_001765 [Nippostrongylus brasiliensis]
MTHDGSVQCPAPYMSDQVHTVLTAETLLICVISMLIQFPIISTARRFAGWKSDFSFTALLLISLMALQLYAGELVGHIRFALKLEQSSIDRVLGASFIASFITVVILSVSLILHRTIYTFYPYTAQRVLSKPVLMVYIIVLLLFHILLCAIMLTPYAGYIICPRTLTRLKVDGILTPAILWINRIGNYMVGFTALISYSIICAYLFHRGSLKFNSKNDMRLTFQVTIMSTIGVFYCVYWEFRGLLRLPEPTSTIIYETLTLLYFNAEFCPLFLNSNFRDEFARFFLRKKAAGTKVSIVITKVRPTKVIADVHRHRRRFRTFSAALDSTARFLLLGLNLLRTEPIDS